MDMLRVVDRFSSERRRAFFRTRQYPFRAVVDSYGIRELEMAGPLLRVRLPAIFDWARGDLIAWG